MLKLYVSLYTLLQTPLKRDDRGVTSVEYGLMVALVAIAIVLTVTALSGALRSVFNSISGTLNQPPPAN